MPPRYPTSSDQTQITVLDPPDKGAFTSQAPYRLDLSAVDANNTVNVIVRDGLLTNRPGYLQVTPNTVPGTPIGGILYSNGAQFFTIVGTTVGWYRLNTATSPYTWIDMTGGVPLTAGATDSVRFAIFPFGTQYYLIGVDGYNDPPKFSPDGTTAYANLPGAANFRPKDLTVAANRLIFGNIAESGNPQYFRVRWSDFNDPTTWPAQNFADLSDTVGPVVGVRALNRVSFAIHKDDSQWVGFAQSGAFPFSFEQQDQKPGPVSAASIVSVEGRHYYLSVDSSIYTFDGNRCQHIGEPIRRYIVNHINYANRALSFSVYLRRDRTIYFFFPSGGSVTCDTAVSMNIDSGQFFIHSFASPVSTGFGWLAQASLAWLNGGINDLTPFTWVNLSATYPTWLSMGTSSVPIEILGSTNGIINTFGIYPLDNGAAPNAKWRFGPIALGERGMRSRVTSLETHFKQAAVGQVMTSKVGTTDTLTGDPTFPAELTNTFNISVTDQLNEFDYSTATDGAATGLAEARFAAVDHSTTTMTDWSWEGAVLRSQQLEPA